MADEQVFLSESDTFVSSSRVVVSGTTYAVGNITSVSKRVAPAGHGFVVALFMAAAILFILTIIVFAHRELAGGLILLMVTAAAIWLVVRAMKVQRPTYHVFLAFASGETDVLSSQDEAAIDRVVAAVNQAIVHRG